MVVHPRLLLPSRSNWKVVAATDVLVLQENTRQVSNPYRIITRGFPHYRVAEGDSIDLIQEELGYLSVNAHDYIQGKITSKKIARWLRGSSSPNALSRPFRQDDDDEEIQDEEGYLSDLSTVSNEEMGRTYNTLAGPGRLLRRAISLEDIKKGSAIRHLMLHEDPIQRPASSASVSPPIPSDTLAAHHHHHSHLHTMHDHDHHHHGHQLEPPYELEFHQYAPSTFRLNRARSAMSMNPNEDDYPLYNTDSYHNSHSGKLPFYDRDLDDSLTMFGSKAPMDYLGSRGRSGDEGISGADRDDPATSATGPLGWLNASPILDAIVSWVEGPAQRSSIKKSDKPNPILDIPFQFIALLTFPEPDPKAGNKMSLAMVRETAFVKQRRKTLMMFTAYTLLVRYCSFDFFLVLLFASNCGLLFLMKNSGRMNVNMAKRAVNQRVGWAKQWAGGIFKKGQGSGGHGQESGAQHQPYHTSNGMGGSSSSAAVVAATAATAAQPSSKPSPPTSSAAHAESIRNVAPSMAGDKVEGHPQEEGTQVKKRGLFGKRKTTNPSSTAPNGAAPQNGSGSGPVVSLLLDSAHGGDEASIMTGRQKRGGFFKRSSGTSSRSATAPPGTIASAVAAIHNAIPPVTKSLTASTSTPSNVASSQTSSTAQQNTATASTTTATTAGTSSQAPTQAQTQPFPLQQVPARPPTPSALRKETTSPKPCVVTPPPSNHAQQHPVDSPPSSGTASVTSSPKAMPTVMPPPQPIARSLSSIHPRSFLAGFSLSQKQQNISKSNPPSIMSASTSTSASTATTTSTNINTSETATPTAFAPGIIISTATTVPISPRPLNAIRLSMPVSILVGSACTTSTTSTTTTTTPATAAAAAAAVDQLEAVAPALFEGDDVEESLEYVLPASKYSTLPDTLAPASTTGSMAPTTAPPTLDHHQESSHKPGLPMTTGYWSTTKEGVLEAVTTTTTTAAVAVATTSQDAVESTTTTTKETPSGEA
ncbi:MAG: hypothetical protein J3Q66DRAFT_321210 [Benniella sp.]|nr:MAG: hypothetical protein J3Q66DRAFT_321210 [Benniella sp.]